MAPLSARVDVRLNRTEQCVRESRFDNRIAPRQDMAKAQGQRGRDFGRSVTVSRVARLYRLLTLLAKGALPRLAILRRLRLNQRGFYRDIELLRAVGVLVVPHEGRYHLQPSLTDALNRLPFPDPKLTLGEAQRLAQGRSSAHRALKARVDQIIG